MAVKMKRKFTFIRSCVEDPVNTFLSGEIPCNMLWVTSNSVRLGHSRIDSKNRIGEKEFD